MRESCPFLEAKGCLPELRAPLSIPGWTATKNSSSVDMRCGAYWLLDALAGILFLTAEMPSRVPRGAFGDA